MSVTNARLRQAIHEAGLPEPAAGKVHLCGIRIGPQGSNKYDDLILAFGNVSDSFPCTVDPGATWSKHPGNPNGAAHLTWGRWRYKPGLHKGKPALVQAAPVTVR